MEFSHTVMNETIMTMHQIAKFGSHPDEEEEVEDGRPNGGLEQDVPPPLHVLAPLDIQLHLLKGGQRRVLFQRLAATGVATESKATSHAATEMLDNTGWRK